MGAFSGNGLPGDLGADVPQIPIPNFTQQAQLEAAGMKAAGWFADLWAALFAAFAPGIFIVISTMVSVIDTIAAPFVQAITAMQAGKYPGAVQMIAAAMGDLLGFEVDAKSLQAAFGHGEIAGIRGLGSKLLSQLHSEMEPLTTVTPESGIGAAEAFLGFALQFAVRQGNVEFILDLLPEQFRLLEGLRSYGELMARNLSLGRLTRLALAPMFKALIQDPLTWYYNQKYRPTKLGASSAIKAFNRGLISQDLLNTELQYAGYADNLAAALIAETVNPLTPDEVFLLVLRGALPESQLLQTLTLDNWSNQSAQYLYDNARFKAAQSHYQSTLAVYGKQRLDGDLDQGTFESLVGALPIWDQERTAFLAWIAAQLAQPRAHVTWSEAVTAFADGVVDVSYLQDQLNRIGYGPDDQAVLMALSYIKLGKQAEAIKVAQFNYDAKVAKANKAGTEPPPPPPILVTS